MTAFLETGAWLGNAWDDMTIPFAPIEHVTCNELEIANFFGYFLFFRLQPGKSVLNYKLDKANKRACADGKTQKPAGT